MTFNLLKIERACQRHEMKGSGGFGITLAVKDLRRLLDINKQLLEACKRMVAFEDIVIGTENVENYTEMMARVDETLKMGKAAIAEAEGNK